MVSFVGELNKLIEERPLGEPLGEVELGYLMNQAAWNVLQAAIAGQVIRDGLNRDQLGAVLAALQWNLNPLMRKAVRVNGGNN